MPANAKPVSEAIDTSETGCVVQNDPYTFRAGVCMGVL